MTNPQTTKLVSVPYENDRYIPRSNDLGGWGTWDQLEKRFVTIDEMRMIGLERLKNEKLPTN